jgi:polyphenol oxidase
MQVSRYDKNGVAFYAAENFNCGGATHGFSTRLGGVSESPFDSLNLGLDRGDDPLCVEENFRRFCAAIGAEQDPAKLVCSKQVHADRVRTVTLTDAGKGLVRERDYEADGLITDVPGLPLVIFSADCISVLLHDPVRRVVGACHAGWRGTALGIAAKTVQRMQEVYGCDPKDIRGAIGAGISRCCFETDADVPNAMRQALGDAAEAFIDAHPNGKFHVDLKGINRHWLLSVGVPAEQIAVCDACTACDTNTFFSHRRTGNARGSLAAVIELL